MLFVVFGFVLCSCNSQDENIESYWYSSVSTMIEGKENGRTEIKNLFFDDGKYYATIDFYEIKDGVQDLSCMLYEINQDGKIKKELKLPAEVKHNFINAISNGKYYSIDTNNVLHVINLSSGQQEFSRSLGSGIHKGIYIVDEGIVVLSDDEVILYTMDGIEKVRVPAGNLSIYSYTNAFFVNDNHYYLIAGNPIEPTIYDIDFEEKKIDVLFQANSSVGVTYSGNMAFTAEGVYSIDVSNKSLIPITEWNYCDIKPSNGYAVENDYSLDGERFSKIYSYPNGDVEILTFKKQKSEDYDSRKILTIGGYGVSDSDSVKWAVYNYNRSQKEYRIFIDEYNRKYSYADGNEAQSALLKLIQDFNEGGAPDIFYGFGFDYRYFYNSGMVIDMYPLIKEDKSFSMDNISESVVNSFLDDGICYQLYSGYVFNGYWGLKENFDSKESVSYLDIQKLAEEKGIPGSINTHPVDYVDTIIRYSFDEIMGKGLSEDQLTEILNYANNVNYGGDSERAVAEGQCLTYMRFVYGLYDLKEIEESMNKSIVYLGRPSIYGVTHTIDPDGLVAISSSSDHPEECWNFIKYMFDEQVQESIASYGINPVNKNVLNEFINYSKNPNQVNRENYIMFNYFRDKKKVPDWIINDYLDMVDSVDSVVTYDWGIFNIISEEVDAFTLGKKSIGDVSKSLKSRLTIYWSENY